MKRTLLMTVLVLGAAAVFDASASGEKTPQSDSQRLTGIRRIEEALFSALNDSVVRDGEIAKKAIEVLDKISTLNEKAGKRAPKKPIKDSLTSAELDEFNMLLAQLKYLNASNYAELLKRRSLREIESLLEVVRVQDEVLAEFVANGNLGNVSDINVATNQRLAKELGLNTGEWGMVLDTVKEAQKRKDARTIALKNLVPRLKSARLMASADGDDLEFMMQDDLRNATSFKIFLTRLQTERSRGNTNAEEVWKYLSEEMSADLPSK